MNTQKKQSLIIAALLALLLVIAVLYFYWPSSQAEKTAVVIKPTETSEPIFMTSEEKTKLYIPEATKIQIVNRNDQGETTVYRIINNDSDIVVPSEVAPIRPDRN